MSRVMRVRLNTKKSSVLGGLGGLLAIGGCSAALLVPNEYARLVLSATLCAAAPIWFLGIAAQQSVVVDFSSVSKRERMAFLFWNTISIIIGLTGLGAFCVSFIATSFDAKVSVGLAALLVGFSFCWKTANRHGAMLIASKDKVR
jgi:hypothetical protein